MSGSLKGRLRTAALVLVVLTPVCAAAVGPVFFDDDEAVSIFRDFDDGLFGRSIYRGVVFSVKLESFDRYRSLPVKELDGLTGYLLSGAPAVAIADDRIFGVTPLGWIDGASGDAGEEPGLRVYRYSRNGIDIEFSLERAPEDLYDEVDRTYSDSPDVAELVKESYRNGWIIRIHVAENVYRPGVARIDYEDILVSASLLGDDFQPLWGLHDGNAQLSVQP